MTFNLSRSALDFLLEQVTIGIDYSKLGNALDPRGLREVAGTNNNLVGSSAGSAGPFTPGPYSGYGTADTEFLRLSQTSYSPLGSNGSYAYGIDRTSDNAVTAADNNIFDASPRLVSLLISTSDTTKNPAAAEAMRDLYGLSPTDPLPNNNPNSSDPLLPNAGVLGGGKFNGWLVAFGQFFDHGLDFIKKGGNGTITISLSPNDPNYNPALPPEQNVMRVARATLANPDSDFTNGVLKEGVTPIYNNNTAMMIDQSQTYGSHASVNAFLREYTDQGGVTGHILAGHTELGAQSDAADTSYSQGLATWADLKINAQRLGIHLTDQDVGQAPMLRVDATGKLLFTPNPNANWTTSSVVTGPQSADDPFVRNADGTVKMTGQPFLIDINPTADPNFLADGPGYDAALLNAHFVAGDGRINENYMVTAVHNVFHEEHNYQVENLKDSILAKGDLALLNQWLSTPATAMPTSKFNLNWDGEKLFQAARLITESEYNHIAIDQFVGALYGALPEFVSYSSDINLGVSLEFSQSVFRLGHSMLNNTLSLLDPNSDPNNPTEQVIGLMNGALNPTGFTLTGAEAITLGLVRQTGEEIDEFLAPSVQNTLNGQLLDLGAIDIARGRDVGLPTLNELRKQIYDGLLQYTNNTNGGALAPYQNWADFGDHLRHQGTLVNMLAAYARGGDGGFGDAIKTARANYQAGAGSLDNIRAAAQAVIDAYAADYASKGYTAEQHAAAVQFMVGTPTYHADTKTWTFEGANQGFWDVDLWIGGLAERPLFDGPLGTTFSYILLDFAQRMQDGDRFYYLYRTPMGTALGDEIIANQFGDLVSRATGIEHLNGDVFIAADKYFFLDGSRSMKGQAPQMTNIDSDNNIDDYFNAALHFLDDGVTRASSGHIVVVGGTGNDYIVGGLGDDTLYGDEGNDFLQGSQGNDHIYGGDGDDYITDDENDDFIRGGAGNDTIFAGPGAIDTVFGDEGDDEIHGGDGIDELMGGDGDDIIYGDGDTDVLFGEDGNDYLFGGDSVDEVWGGNGNDWLRGGVGDDHLVGGSGHDLLEGGIGPSANDGDRLIGEGAIDFSNVTPPDNGFDVVTYQNVDIAVTADLQTSNANGTGALLDTYSGIDGVVGSRFNDKLTGAGADTPTDNGINNLLVGGAGNDTLTGLGGDDRILGDSVVVHNDFTVATGSYTVISNWRGTGQKRPQFADGSLGYFLGDNGPAGTTDRVVFSGNFADYIITTQADGWIRVVDKRGIDSTAVGDLVKDVELFQFADGTRTVDQLANQAPTDIRWNAAAPPDNSLPGSGTIATLSTVDPDNTTPFTYSATSSLPSGFSLTSAGVITRSGGTLSSNATYVFNLRTTDAGGKFFNETIRILTGSSNSNTITGNGGDDVVYASSGNDTINGLAGNDNLFGQSGNDVLNGGDGADMLNGGSGTDTASYAGATAAVAVSLALSGAQNTGGAGRDTLVSIENLTGSSFDDTLTGNTSANILTGGAGNDALNGAGGSDTAAFSGSRANYGFSLGAANAIIVADNVGTDGVDTLTSIENIVFGNQELTLWGGTSGADNLSGGFGDDLLLGFGGNDSLSGSWGSDVLVGGSGNDSLNGGSNSDTAAFSGPLGNYGFSLGASGAIVVTDNVGTDGVDTLTSIESVQFGTQTFSLDAGSNSGQTLSGGNGADLLLGFGGNDVLRGNGGADVLFGGTGNDTFDFNSTSDSPVGVGTRDIIMDFAVGDILDFNGIDANTGSFGNQNFSFIGTAAFTGVAQLRYQLIDTDGVGGVDSLLVQGNVGGSLAADFEVLLKNFTGTLSAGQLIL